MKEIIKYITVVLVSCGFCYGIITYKTPVIAYVDITKAYAEFKLTKELDSKIKATNEHRKTILDSLGLTLKMLESKVRMDAKNEEHLKFFELQRQQYYMKQEQFNKDYEEQSQEYNAQILKQINQYTEEFRMKKNLDVIIGANGNGFLMAGSPKMDATADFVQYINSAYNGK